MKKVILISSMMLMGMMTINAQSKSKKPAVAAQVEYTIDVASTTVKWLGKKVGGEHYGHIKVKTGSIVTSKNSLKSANITMDMNSMTCDDIANAEYNTKLISHLKHSDFFNTEAFPEATLKINKVVPGKNGNSKLLGILTIKGKSHPVNFSSNISFADNNLTAKGNLVFNRTKFDIKYSSGILGTAKDKIIYDDVTLEINLTAVKK